MWPWNWVWNLFVRSLLILWHFIWHLGNEVLIFKWEFGDNLLIHQMTLHHWNCVIFGLIKHLLQCPDSNIMISFALFLYFCTFGFSLFLDLKALRLLSCFRCTIIAALVFMQKVIVMKMKTLLFLVLSFTELLPSIGTRSISSLDFSLSFHLMEIVRVLVVRLIELGAFSCFLFCAQVGLILETPFYLCLGWLCGWVYRMPWWRNPWAVEHASTSVTRLFLLHSF